MSGFSPRALKSFEVARAAARALTREGVGSAIIGSVALAIHGYVRATRDLDLGVTVLAFDSLQRVADRLRSQGYDVEVSAPAPDDPIGGVVNVSGHDFDTIQIVNLRAPGGRHEALGREAIETARHIKELDLPVVDLPHLVALKLAADSRKDELDVLELLSANPELPLEELRALCGRYRLKARLERLLSGA
jgi:hypothetical protein